MQNLSIVNLQLEYKKTLSEYETTFKNYLNLTSSTNDLNTDSVIVPEYAYWGQTALSSANNLTTAEQCKALCSANPNCQGATFVTNNCFLRSGVGSLIPNKPNSYAIVKKSIIELNHLQELNNKLIELNRQITEAINATSTTTTTTMNTTTNTNTTTVTDELNLTYQQLLESREKINNMLSTSEISENNNLEANMNLSNYNYFFLILFIVIILFIATVTVFTGSSQSNVYNPNPIPNPYNG
jgi:hypothetical protein